MSLNPLSSKSAAAATAAADCAINGRWLIDHILRETDPSQAKTLSAARPLDDLLVRRPELVGVIIEALTARRNIASRVLRRRERQDALDLAWYGKYEARYGLRAAVRRLFTFSGDEPIPLRAVADLARAQALVRAVLYGRPLDGAEGKRRAKRLPEA